MSQQTLLCRSKLQSEQSQVELRQEDFQKQTIQLMGQHLFKSWLNKGNAAPH